MWSRESFKVAGHDAAGAVSSSRETVIRETVIKRQMNTRGCGCMSAGLQC